MSKNNHLVANFLQRNAKVALKPQPKAIANSFEQMFAHRELSQEEKGELNHVLSAELECDEKVQFSKDFEHIASVSAQVRSIQKQGILLIGERIHSARQILAQYVQCKRLLTKWMQFSFSSLKTAYNALAYYDLYQKLPSDQWREKYKEMPAKASYILASRQGSMDDKLHIIENHKNKFATELIEEIRLAFPLDKKDKRRQKQENVKDVLFHLDQIIAKLEDQHLSEELKGQIQKRLSVISNKI